MKKTNISVHFTTKGQTVEEIQEKLTNFFNSQAETTPQRFQVNLTHPMQKDEYLTSERTVFHHCFLPLMEVKNRNFPTSIYDVVLNHLRGMRLCWYGISDFGIHWDRKLMLENLYNVGGVALFVGEIKDGVKDEFEMVKRLGIDFIIIP